MHTRDRTGVRGRTRGASLYATRVATVRADRLGLTS